MILFCLLLAFSNAVFSQCGKHVILTSSRTGRLDAMGNEIQTMDEKTVIDINKNKLTITINNDAPIAGIIHSDSCLWKVPYKDGKTMLKTVMTEQDGTPINANITILGIKGSITLLFEVLDVANDNMKVEVDKFEDKN